MAVVVVWEPEGSHWQVATSLLPLVPLCNFFGMVCVCVCVCVSLSLSLSERASFVFGGRKWDLFVGTFALCLLLWVGYALKLLGGLVE